MLIKTLVKHRLYGFFIVIIDHNNEETVKSVLDQGFYAAFTIYPFTKMGNERMVEVVKQYGSERIMINSAADWGISDPLAIPKTAALMKIKGIADEDIRLVTYQNAIDAFAQSGQINVADFEAPVVIDQSLKFNGNTVLRGGHNQESIKIQLLFDKKLKPIEIKPYLQLTRPANISDGNCGYFGRTFYCDFFVFDERYYLYKRYIFIGLSTIGFYGGGIVFNDIFDLELDKIERPERVIPSGKVKQQCYYFWNYLVRY